MKIRSFSKKYLQFLPLLALYIVVIFVFASDELRPDENRYLEYATNLTNSYFANVDNPVISSGPGYPLAIALLVLCNAPYIVIQILNALFIIVAVVFLFKTLVRYLEPRPSIIICYLFGLYPPMIRFMIHIYTEPFAIMLACGFLYYSIKLNKQASNKYLHAVLAGSFLGLLALTRVTFGYVIIIAIILYLIIYLFKKSKKIFHTLIVLVSGFMVCVPFLFYTYNVTGQFFYWGTHGGAILYWHSTPFQNEYGDWISSSVVLGSKDHPFYDTSKVIENHISFIQKVESPSNSMVQKDKMYKEKAFENMKQYPFKYIQNTCASALRLFFDYPISYKTQSMTTYFYLLPNIFLVVFLILVFYLSILKFKAIPFEIRFIAVISLFYIGGLVMTNGRVRHLLPILPLLLFYIGVILERFTRFEITQGLNKDKLGIDKIGVDSENI